MMGQKHLLAEPRATLDPVRVERGYETIVSNPISGPIRVPQRIDIGDSGISSHRLALGASTFGWTMSFEDSHAVLDRFAALGGDLVDSADSYAAGRSESIIGAWMRSRRTRDRVSIATKIGRDPARPGLSPAAIVASVDASLERLGSDRIDLLYFHGEDDRVPLEESLGAIDALVTAGKIRAIGASDFSPERLIEARVLAANGLPKFSAVTCEYNLMRRSRYEGTLDLVAHAQRLAVLPYFALANGFLAGHVRRRRDIRGDTRGTRQGEHIGRRGHRVLAVLDRIAVRRGVQPATVALAWLLAKRNVAAPVASVSHADQIAALMAAALLELHRAEVIELDRASA